MKKTGQPDTDERIKHFYRRPAHQEGGVMSDKLRIRNLKGGVHIDVVNACLRIFKEKGFEFKH